MSILKKLIAAGDIMHFADYRRGSAYDLYQGITGTQTNTKVIKGGVNVPNNGLISFGNGENLASFTNITLMISGNFFKVPSGQYFRPVSKRDGSLNHFDLAIDASVISFNDGAGSYNYTTSNASSVKSLAISYANNSQLKFYKNGLLDQTTTVTTSMVAKATALTIGGSNIAANLYRNYQIKYSLLSNRVLTATEISTLTAELEVMPDQRPSSRAINSVNALVGNGTVDAHVNYGDILDLGLDSITCEADVYIPLDQNYSSGTEIFSLIGRPLVGSLAGRYYTYIYSNTINSVFQAEAGSTLTKSTSLTPYLGKKIRIKLIIDRTGNYTFWINNVQIGTSSNITAYSAVNYNIGEPFSIGGTASGVLTKKSFKGGIWNAKVWRNGVLVFNAPLTGDTKDIIGGVVPVIGSGFSISKVTYPEIYFKGDLGVLANETATTSGHLENSGCKVLSGSFKMTTEKNSGKIEKVIVCVSTGSIYVTQAVAALTGWRRFVNTGTGYAAVVTDLATARTIPLNTGDKLIWASENHSRSLYQMA